MLRLFQAMMIFNGGVKYFFNHRSPPPQYLALENNLNFDNNTPIHKMKIQKTQWLQSY